MIRQEEINNAKESFYERIIKEGSYYDPRDCFEEGAEWADNNINISSIWNDVNIVPSDNKGIIYLTKKGKIGIIKAIKSNKWDWYVAYKCSIVKWAYIDDLLPKQFGNSEQLKGGEK